MTPDQFWYGDPDDYETYVTAYHDRVNRAAWMNGLYVFEATSAAINNIMPGAIGTAFSKNHKVKPIKYHDKPIDLFQKAKTKQNLSNAQGSNTLSGVAFWSERIKNLKGGGVVDGG